MGRLSDAVMNNILDVYFGNQSAVIPATYYVGLSLTGTAPSNNGATVTEPSGNGYARVAVPNNATNWNTAASRAKTNKLAIVFNQATADWGTVGYFVIYSSLTGTATSDFIGWGALDSTVAVLAGGTPDFQPGALTIDAPGT